MRKSAPPETHNPRPLSPEQPTPPKEAPGENPATVGEKELQKTRKKIYRKINRAIHDFSMFERKDKIAVALSGGKDSVTLLLALKDLGYQVEAFHVKLGIDNFSPKSLAYAEYIEQEYSIKVHTVSTKNYGGFGIDEISPLYRGQECAICGTLKRRIFNRFALDHGFDVLAVGHNMDDEVAMLFGNNIRWELSYLQKSLPVLESREGYIKRVKPLCYLREAEIKAYIKRCDIEVLHCQCPYSAKGSRKKYNKIMKYSSELFPEFVENYYRRFLAQSENLKKIPAGPAPELKPCPECGELSSSQKCRLCRIKEGLWQSRL